MSRIPTSFAQQLPKSIKGAFDAVKLHAQQITTLQSQTAALVPGDWEDIALDAGWSPLGGYIPPQVRILQNGMSQLIGHVTGGSVGDGTVIGTLTAGFFNPVHAHTFTVNAVTGASAAAHAGSLNNTAGAITASNVSVPSADHTFQAALPTSNIPTSDHTFTVTSGHITIGPSTQQFQNIPSSSVASLGMGPSSGNQFSNNINGAATNLTSGATATPVNMNSPTITLDTSGNLTISNVNGNVTTLSFSELIPLVTA